jgi:hypothetical protein
MIQTRRTAMNQTTHKTGVIKGVGVGAGYFSHYQYEAWSRIPDVTITAIP